MSLTTRTNIATAQTAATEATTASLFSAAPYTVGERLTYNVSFATFPSAAYIEVAVAGRTRIMNRESVELRAHVETLGVVNAALYAANNDYRSFVEPRSGVPLRTQITTRDGSRSNDASRDYNQAVGTITTARRAARFQIPGTYDVLSAIFRARALPLTQNSTYRFQIAAGQSTAESYDVELRVTGRELTKTSVGSYNTIVATARTRNPGGRNTDDYLTQIHFTDDDRHVPVLINVRLSAGEIRAELASSTLDDVAPEQIATNPPANELDQPAPFPAAPPASERPADAGAAAATTRRSTPTPAPNAVADPAAPKVGDQLNFNVFLAASSQSVGSIFFDVRGRGRYFDREALLVTATARTSGAGATLFPVNDRITSYLDPASLLPFRSELQLQEGARKLNRILNFEQDAGRVVRADGLRTEIPNNTYDLASLVYALRRFDLTPGRRTSFAIFVANRPHVLTITAREREQITLGGETIPAVQLILTTDAREPDRNTYRLWISDDRRRLPLRFTMTTPLGAVRADLAIIPVTQQ